MRIAVITTSYPSHDQDPSGHFVQTEVRELVDAGHAVTVLCPRQPRHARGHAVGAGAQLCELWHGNLFGWPGALPRMRARPLRAIGALGFVTGARRQLMARSPFDRLVAHWIVPAFWPVCRDFGVPTEVVAHGSDVRLIERFPRSVRLAILSSLSRPHISLRCVSHELAARISDLARAAGVPPPHSVVRAASISIPSLAPKAVIRAELGWSKHLNCLVVGRLVESKRMDLAIEVIRAANRATTRHIGPAPARTADDNLQRPRPSRECSMDAPIPLSIHVIGDGPARALWTQSFPEVQWLGQLNRYETLRHIAAADVLISASALEGSSTVIREARALNTEVVAACSGDLAAASGADAGLHVATDFAPSENSEAVRELAALFERVWQGRKAAAE